MSYLQVWQNKTPRDRLHIDYDRGIKEVLTPYANMEDHDHSVVARNELVESEASWEKTAAKMQIREEGCKLRSVTARQGFSNTELRIVGNSNKLVYLTSWSTALSGTELHAALLKN